MPRLLMISGDTALARGERGPFYNTLSEFAPHWESVVVLTPPVPGVERLELFNNVVVYPSPRSKVSQPFYILDQGRALAKTSGYDLIVSHDYGLYLNGLGAAWLSQALGVPYVSEIHHIEGHPRAANWRERIQPSLARWYVGWARHRASAFRIVNQGELKPLLLAWGVPENKLLLLYSLYLDLAVFRPSPVVPDYDAIFCGRLTANKAPLLFLEGLAHASQLRRTPLRGLMIGRGALASVVKARAKALNVSVDFLDWVKTPDELAGLYRRSRCLICTSYSEGGPRVVAEALACGVPVVTTRVGLASDIVHDGENGFITSWSAAEIGGRIAQLVGDEALHFRLSQAAPAAVQRFEKSSIIREYAQGYQKLITT